MFATIISGVSLLNVRRCQKEIKTGKLELFKLSCLLVDLLHALRGHIVADQTVGANLVVGVSSTVDQNLQAVFVLLLHLGALVATSAVATIEEVLVLTGRASRQTLRLAAIQWTVDFTTGVHGADDVGEGGRAEDGQHQGNHKEGTHSGEVVWWLVVGVVLRIASDVSDRPFGVFLYGHFCAVVSLAVPSS